MKALFKAFAVAIGLALAFGLVGCGDSNESKSESAKSETSQGTKSENVQDAQSENSQNEPPKAPTQDKFSKEALEFAQNLPFGEYQNTTLKQMLEKGTNICASVSWEAEKFADEITFVNNEKVTGSYYLVTAYCEVEDFAGMKARLQQFYKEGYGDFSFDMLFYESKPFEFSYWNGETTDLIKEATTLGLIPGGKTTLSQLSENQMRKVFEYILDTTSIPLSRAINESEKIFIVFPTMVYASDKGCKFASKMQYAGIRLFSYFDVIRSPKLKASLLAFQVQNRKFFADGDNKKDLTQNFFFNKSVSGAELAEGFALDGDRGRHGSFSDNALLRSWRDNIPIPLATPANKKFIYNNDEIAEYEKNLADFIIKVYSEPDVPSTPSTQTPMQTSTSETAANVAQSAASSAQSAAQTAPSTASTLSSKTDSLPSLKLATKDEYVNLRKAPSGEILTPIYKKDFDKITIKRLDGGDAKWLKVLYFPPNVSDESKALTGYIHISQIAK